MDEFGFIAKYLSELAGPEALDLKDDVAIWSPDPSQDVVMSMDTIVEGVHFPTGKFDAELAQKLIRVNMSDLIAKGATPLGYLLSLNLPKAIKQDGLKDFCEGLKEDQEKYGIKLWGGDTTRSDGPCTLSATFVGVVAKGKARLRSGAREGDLLCVTGQIGDAYLGLKIVLGQDDMSGYEGENWLSKYHLPCPPFKAAKLIRKFANASMDVSDGLIADLSHLAKASGLKAEIKLGDIPVSGETRKWIRKQASGAHAVIKLVTGGDDYQALMSVPPTDAQQFIAQAKALGVDITIIGTMGKGEGVICLNSKGEEVSFSKTGYIHF